MSFKKLMLVAGFAVNSLQLGAQQANENHPSPSPAPRLGYKPAKTEALLLLGCRHSDRKTPYREINPGVLFLSHINENISTQRGGYFNSNYGFSTTTGSVAEIKMPVGRHFYGSVGVMAGVSLYARKQPNSCSVKPYHKMPFEEAPQDVKKKGYSRCYTQLEDGRWFEIETIRNPRGKGIQRPRVMILFLASFMHNSGNGVFGMFAVGPHLGTNGGTGSLAAGGLRVNTDPVYNYMMR